METVKELLGLGVDPKNLEFSQVCVRAIVVFFAALVMVRISDRRFLAKLSAFDFILGLILASMLSRAVNGSAPFFGSLGAGFVLVILHRVLAAGAFHSKTIGLLIKGEPDVLVTNGQVHRHRLKAHSITESDLIEEARLNGQIGSIEHIGLAVMERNGHISVLPKTSGRSG